MNIPGYQILSPVAQGGFASVYRARQVAFDREVAVKVLTVELGDGRDRRRFERECALTGRLTGHPAIVTILDSGFTDHGQPYLTTPYYHAGSLAERLAHEGPFSVAETLRMGVAVAGALEMAHRNGILHRDLKPGNILLSAYGEPALTDFGIAALVQPGGAARTQTTQAFTIDHAPPEVLQGAKATVGSDIYGLASTLWTLLAGEPPFAGGDPGLIPRALKVQNEPVPPIGRDDVPASLEAVLARAMAKRSEDRYDTAAAFGEALQQVQQEIGEPVTPLRADAPLRTPSPEQELPATEPLTIAAGAPAAGAAAHAPSLASSAARSGSSAPPPPPAPAPSAFAPPPPAGSGAPPRWRGADSGWYADDGAAPEADARPEPGPPIGPDPGRSTLAAPPVVPRPRGDAPRSGPGELAADDGQAAEGGHVVVAPPLQATPAVEDDRSTRERSGFRPDVVAVVLVLGLVVAIVLVVLRLGNRDTTITTPNPGDAAATTSTAPTTAAPVSSVTTAAPAPSTSAAAPTTAARSTAPTTAAPTTAAPAPTPAAGGGPILPDGASPQVRDAAAVAQEAGTALADADWSKARTMIPSLAGTGDAALDQGWGRLDGVTMVVTDSKSSDGRPVTLRVGEVAHERNTDDSRRTTLYCATWTVDGGRVTGMAAQQTIAPSPWRAGWADPAEAVEVLRAQCQRL